MGGPTQQLAKIRWAPRLRPGLLKRLYDSDARGLRDPELCDQVGSTLYARCCAFMLVHRRQVECPSCGQILDVARDETSRCPGRGCGWSTTQPVYWQSVRNHYAHTGRATEAFARFCERYPAARSYGARMVLIDQLIHSFHLAESTGSPVKSVASKLLEGNKTEVVRFLDELSALDPAAKERWRQTASTTLHRRHLKASPND